MSTWTLLILLTATWSLWAIGGFFALEADKLEGKRKPDAGFSVVPIIPLFPLVAFGAAMLLNKFMDPWGTRVVGGFHGLLTVVFLVGIFREVLRVWSSKRQP